MEQDASLADALRDIQQQQTHLLAAIESLSSRVEASVAIRDAPAASPESLGTIFQPDSHDKSKEAIPSSSIVANSTTEESIAPAASPSQRSGLSSRIILT